MAQSSVVSLLKINEKVALNSVNYAQIAEFFMTEKDASGNRILRASFSKLTTSKIRGIYGLIMNLYTRVNVPEDFDSCFSDLQYIKVKMAYESGRDEIVKEFINITKLMDCIDAICTYEQFVLYCRYAESLVAYFKFYGGKDSAGEGSGR